MHTNRRTGGVPTHAAVTNTWSEITGSQELSSSAEAGARPALIGVAEAVRGGHDLRIYDIRAASEPRWSDNGRFHERVNRTRRSTRPRSTWLPRPIWQTESCSAISRELRLTPGTRTSFTIILVAKGKDKVLPYSFRALGPELIPVYRQSARRCLEAGGRLPLLSARPAVTFSAEERHSPSAGTKLYCLVTEAHACEQLAQGCYLEVDRPRFEPATFWIASERSTLPLSHTGHNCSSYQTRTPAFRRERATLRTDTIKPANVVVVGRNATFWRKVAPLIPCLHY